MSLSNIQVYLTLDVYDHDTTPSTIKAIACDDNVRYVAAKIQNGGTDYSVDANAVISLTILRPDKTGVSITGSTFVMDEESDSYNGVVAELNASSLAQKGTLLGQFKIETDEQILRTEIFYINNGRALDADVTEWSGDYSTYNLDELAEKIDFVLNALQDLVGSDVNIQAAITTTQTYVDNRISVHDDGIYINT